MFSWNCINSIFSTTDSSDKRGDDAGKKFAVAQSEAADIREKRLTALQKKTRPDIIFTDEPDADRSNRLAGLNGAVGKKYLTNFYAAEISEYDAAISLLTMYGTKPDSDDIRQFAANELPAMQDGLKRSRLAAPKQ